MTDMTHEEAKASMGIATRLQDMLLPQGQEMGAEGSQTQNPDQEGGQTGQPQKDPMAEIMTLKDEIMNELQKVRDDIKEVSKGNSNDEKSEIADLKKQIEDVLNE